MLFIDASRDFEAGNNQNRLRDRDRARILDAYRPPRPWSEYAYLATPAEIAENDFNLNIPRYVDTFEPEPRVDMAAVNRDIRTLRTQLSEVEARMEGYLKELGLDG